MFSNQYALFDTPRLPMSWRADCQKEKAPSQNCARSFLPPNNPGVVLLLIVTVARYSGRISTPSMVSIPPQPVCLEPGQRSSMFHHHIVGNHQKPRVPLLFHNNLSLSRTRYMSSPKSVSIPRAACIKQAHSFLLRHFEVWGWRLLQIHTAAANIKGDPQLPRELSLEI